MGFWVQRLTSQISGRYLGTSGLQGPQWADATRWHGVRSGAWFRLRCRLKKERGAWTGTGAGRGPGWTAPLERQEGTGTASRTLLSPYMAPWALGCSWAGVPGGFQLGATTTQLAPSQAKPAWRYEGQGGKAGDELSKDGISPLWGSNPRPYAYEAHALPTELRRPCFAASPGNCRAWGGRFTRSWGSAAPARSHVRRAHRQVHKAMKQLRRVRIELTTLGL